MFLDSEAVAAMDVLPEAGNVAMPCSAPPPPLLLCPNAYAPGPVPVLSKPFAIVVVVVLVVFVVVVVAVVVSIVVVGNVGVASVKFGDVVAGLWAGSGRRDCDACCGSPSILPVASFGGDCGVGDCRRCAFFFLVLSVFFCAFLFVNGASSRVGGIGCVSCLGGLAKRSKAKK